MENTETICITTIFIAIISVILIISLIFGYFNNKSYLWCSKNKLEMKKYLIKLSN